MSLTPRTRWPDFVPAMAGGVTSLIGVIVLVGWLLDIGALKSVHPAFISMKFNTALGLVLLGAAVALVHPPHRSRLPGAFVSLAAACVVLFGAATLAQDLFRVDLGIDQLLQADDPQPTRTVHPGRPAVMTSVNFVLLGSALLLFARRRKLAQVLVLAAVLSALFSIAGYAYGVEALQGLSFLTPLAIHTAGAFVLAGAGLLAAQTDSGIVGVLRQDTLGSFLARRLLPAALVFPIFVGWLVLLGEHAGFYGPHAAFALQATAQVAILVLLLASGAVSLNRIDSERTLATESVRRLEESEARRQAAEESLRKSEQRFRRAFAEGPIGMSLVSLEGRYLEVNAAFASMLEYLPSELVGRSYLDVTAPEDRDASASLLAQLVSGEASRGTLEKTFLTRSGRRVQVIAHRAAITDAASRPDHIFVIYDNITDRKLLESQFRQAQKMEAVGRLAGGVAHDFNNLLTVINGYAEVLGESLARDREASSQVEEIAKAGARAAGLTRQLLAFSRKQILQPYPFDPGSSVRDLESLLRRLIGEDIRLEVRVSEGIRSVVADPGQFEQVILNLAVNARDAMPRGGRLSLQVRNVDLDREFSQAHVGVTPGPYVLLAVEDTGTGMTPEVVSHLFEPFFTTKGVGKGTGLGLCAVYGIVKQSGGHVVVSSEPGQGTTFSIYLPASADGPLQVPPPTASGPGEVCLGSTSPRSSDPSSA